MASLVDDHYETLMARRNDIAARLYREPHLKQKLAEIDKELEIYDFSKFTKGQNPMTTTPADEIDAVEAALEAGISLSEATSEEAGEGYNADPRMAAGRTAFAAIVSRLRELEAENARLKAALTEIRDRDGSFWNLNLLADRALKADPLAASEEAKP